jgi:hypothetical protein
MTEQDWVAVWYRRNPDGSVDRVAYNVDSEEQAYETKPDDDGWEIDEVYPTNFPSDEDDHD